MNARNPDVTPDFSLRRTSDSHASYVEQAAWGGTMRVT
jgi:hypothetical protein